MNAKPLTMQGVHHAYGRTPVLEGVDLDVDAGRVVGLVGPNGCGKTTTLRAAAGVLVPSRGSILVGGFDHRAPAARASAAYVPDEPTGFDELTVGEFLDLYRALYRDPPAVADRARRVLAAFALADRANAPLASLSHGMRRQVAMVAAFARGAQLVIVDEATAALDPEAVIVLREAVRTIATRGAGVLVATQDLHFAEAACDDIYLLECGRVLAHGPLDALGVEFAATTLESIFLHALGRAPAAEEVRHALEAV